MNAAEICAFHEYKAIAPCACGTLCVAIVYVLILGVDSEACMARDEGMLSLSSIAHLTSRAFSHRLAALATWLGISTDR